MGAAIERSNTPQTDLAKLEQSSRWYFCEALPAAIHSRARKHTLPTDVSASTVSVELVSRWCELHFQ